MLLEIFLDQIPSAVEITVVNLVFSERVKALISTLVLVLLEMKAKRIGIQGKISELWGSVFPYKFNLCILFPLEEPSLKMTMDSA